MTMVEFTPGTVREVAGILEDENGSLDRVIEVWRREYPKRAKFYVLARLRQHGWTRLTEPLPRGPFAFGPISTSGKATQTGRSVALPGATHEWLSWWAVPLKGEMAVPDGQPGFDTAPLQEVLREEHPTSERMAKALLAAICDAWEAAHPEVTVAESKTDPTVKLALPGRVDMGADYHAAVVDAWGGTVADWAKARKEEASAIATKDDGETQSEHIVKMLRERGDFT